VCQLPRGAHPKNKVWPSKLGVGHEADNLILEKILMFISPKKVAGMVMGKDLANKERI
jgi:hypothetical protein